MRYFFTRREPPDGAILLVESGSRSLIEALLPSLRANYPNARIDLVTCFPGLPNGLRADQSSVFRISDYRGDYRRLIRELRPLGYTTLGIICSAESIMTKWKWAIAFGVPAKVFVLNENGDYFWMDWSNWATMRHFVLFRAGLAGPGAVRTIGRLFLFPLTLLYLLSFAAIVHTKRWARLRFGENQHV